MRVKDAARTGSIGKDEDSVVAARRMDFEGEITPMTREPLYWISRTMTAADWLWEFRLLPVHVPPIRLNYEGAA